MNIACAVCEHRRLSFVFALRMNIACAMCEHRRLSFAFALRVNTAGFRLHLLYL